MPGKRTVSIRQLNVLLRHMEENPDVARGRFEPGAMGLQRAQIIWDKVTEELNRSNGDGCTKITKLWRQYWSDIKCVTKKRAAEVRQNIGGVGEAGRRTLTFIDKRVLNVLGMVSCEGNPSVQIPIVVESKADVPSPAQELSPQLKEYPSQGQEYPPQAQEYPPQAQEYPPQAQEYPSQAQEYPPQAQKYPPQAQELSPQAQELPPPAEDPLLATQDLPSPTDHLLLPLDESSEESNSPDDNSSKLSTQRRSGLQIGLKANGTPREARYRSQRRSRSRDAKPYRPNNDLPMWARRFEERRLRIDEQRAQSQMRIADVLEEFLPRIATGLDDLIHHLNRD